MLEISIALAAARVRAGGLLIIAAVVMFFLVIFYVWKVRKAFASIPRLEKPWSVLGAGVALLFLGVLFITIEDVISFSTQSMGMSMEPVVEVGDAVIAVAAFVILAAMVMMKRAWTVQPVE